MSLAVIGLGFGDEGKGLVTNYLCSHFPDSLVIRYSGGHQAGHTVVTEQTRHVFTNFGSGTLSGAPTYWSKFCTVEPIGLINELHTLSDVCPTLYIDKKCPITTPYDIYNNFLLNKQQKHGTCGVGFGSTLEREESMYSLLAEDLLYPAIVKIKTELIQKYYSNISKEIDLHLIKFYKAISDLINFPNIHIISKKQLPQGCVNIYEGSQGLLLDQNIGFFPHVTRSNVGTKNILAQGERPLLYLVTRAYQTRHGKGIMTNSDIPHNITINKDETNVTNKFQGKFRRSLLDLDLLLYGISKDEYIKNNIQSATLVITCLDHIINEYRFTYKENIVYCNNEKDFVSRIGRILGINNSLLSRTPYSDKLESYQII